MENAGTFLTLPGASCVRELGLDVDPSAMQCRGGRAVATPALELPKSDARSDTEAPSTGGDDEVGVRGVPRVGPTHPGPAHCTPEEAVVEGTGGAGHTPPGAWGVHATWAAATWPPKLKLGPRMTLCPATGEVEGGVVPLADGPGAGGGSGAGEPRVAPSTPRAVGDCHGVPVGMPRRWSRKLP